MSPILEIGTISQNLGLSHIKKLIASNNKNQQPIEEVNIVLPSALYNKIKSNSLSISRKVSKIFINNKHLSYNTEISKVICDFKINDLMIRYISVRILFQHGLPTMLIKRKEKNFFLLLNIFLYNKKRNNSLKKLV